MRRAVLLYSLMALMSVAATSVGWALLQEGTGGQDVLYDTPQADQQFGFGAHDVLNGRGGPDFVNVKDDKVQNDTVDCGPGDDTVRRDFILALPPRGDAIENCEHVVNN